MKAELAYLFHKEINYDSHWNKNKRTEKEKGYDAGKARGISQLKLALDLNMNQNSISRYETGEREADYATLIKFADYFGVSIDYLLERTDNPMFLN